MKDLCQIDVQIYTFSTFIKKCHFKMSLFYFEVYI